MPLEPRIQSRIARGLASALRTGKPAGIELSHIHVVKCNDGGAGINVNVTIEFGKLRTVTYAVRILVISQPT